MLLRLLLIIAPALAINPCKIDPGACLPLEDFEVNCTCILIHGKPRNTSDDKIFMYLLGHQIPFNLFKQMEMPPLFRKKLRQRLPSSLNFEPALELSAQIVQSLKVQEEMALFIVNSTYSMEVLTQLANNSILKTDEAKNFPRFCSEGECNIVLDSTVVFNSSAGLYSHAADILQVIEMRGVSLFASSSVIGEFSIPKVQSQICEQRCTKFQPGDGLMCRNHCTQKMRYDNVALIGQLKRDFQMFVRAAAAKNLRERFNRYISDF